MTGAAAREDQRGANAERFQAKKCQAAHAASLHVVLALPIRGNRACLSESTALRGGREDNRSGRNRPCFATKRYSPNNRAKRNPAIISF